MHLSLSNLSMTQSLSLRMLYCPDRWLCKLNFSFSYSTIKLPDSSLSVSAHTYADDVFSCEMNNKEASVQRAICYLDGSFNVLAHCFHFFLLARDRSVISTDGFLLPTGSKQLVLKDRYLELRRVRPVRGTGFPLRLSHCSSKMNSVHGTWTPVDLSLL